MPFEQTFAHNFLIGFDDWGAALLFNQNDISISTLTRMVEMGTDAPLKLYKWQKRLLSWIGPKLDQIQEHHREMALEGDVQRAIRVIQMMKPGYSVQLIPPIGDSGR